MASKLLDSKSLRNTIRLEVAFYQHYYPLADGKRVCNHEMTYINLRSLDDIEFYLYINCILSYIYIFIYLCRIPMNAVKLTFSYLKKLFGVRVELVVAKF